MSDIFAPLSLDRETNRVHIGYWRVDNPEPKFMLAGDELRPEQIETQHSRLRRILTEISRLLADAQELIERSNRTMH